MERRQDMIDYTMPNLDGARQPEAAPRSLSFVIPTLNTRKLVETCVASLEVHHDPDLEVLVVDDGSRDDTVEALRRRHRWARVISLPSSLGFTKAANLGVEAVRGDVVVLLNSDTELEPGSLATLRAAFEREPRLGIVGAALIYPDGTPQWSGGREPDIPWLFALASGLPGLVARIPGYRRLHGARGHAGEEVDWVTGAAIAFRREVWGEIGPLDEDFSFYCQDLDYCVRARAAGWRVSVVPGFRVVHHHGATIGRSSGGLGRQDPQRLWTDLLQWARKRHGAGWARRAARAIRWGGRLRIGGRTVVGWFVPSNRRSGWRRGTGIYRKALGAVEVASRTL